MTNTWLNSTNLQPYLDLGVREKSRVIAPDPTETSPLHSQIYLINLIPTFSFH